MEERYTKIMEKWFLVDPPLFQVLCTHQLTMNGHISCPLRCGRRMLEYNPDIIREMSDTALEEAMRAEAVRILLKHPYERRPDRCSQKTMGLASNIVIGDNYKHSGLNIETPEEYGLKKGMSYEWYATELTNGEDGSRAVQVSGNDERGNKVSYTEGSAENKFADLAGLWEEDEVAVQMINGIIESTTDWGTLGGDFAEKLKCTLKAKINWRDVLRGFRASILNSQRQLTRMKPNRRFGFDYMGSTSRFSSRLLVAVDVSGSITTKNLMYFYGVINSAFRYGFKSLDVVQFDCGISIVQSLQKVVKEAFVVGRGGTSFQKPINYAHNNGYDGLIILTDGYAPQPVIPQGFKSSILWVCIDEACHSANKEWMEKSGKTCIMQI
jgi:predicted metal-dependent peptidase